MSTTQTLIEAFEAAKEKILALYHPEGGNETNSLAINKIASNNYSPLIDQAVAELRCQGALSTLLKASFDITMAKAPCDEGFMQQYVAEYHRRFKEHIAPILQTVPILR